MRLACLAVLFLAMASPVARAQVVEPVPASACTAGVAQVSTLRTVAGDQAAWRGRCVKISGVAVGYFLFGDKADADRFRPRLDPSETGRVLGIDGWRPGKHLSKRRRLTVVGRIGDCERTRAEIHSADTPDMIMFVRGYCHGHNGAYIQVTEARER
ncbi:hypothetical protein [Caulobacter segnis]